jgi:reactive intermediate/imine deaminase
MAQFYVRPSGCPPPNGYSQAVSFTGTTVVVSGQVPVDVEGELVGVGDARAQVRQVFDNLVAALDGAGATLGDVVKLTVYLTDIADLADFRLVRDEYFPMDRPPASSLVEVSRLVHPAFKVEIDAVAAL